MLTNETWNTVEITYYHFFINLNDTVVSVMDVNTSDHSHVIQCDRKRK